jgi:dolichyl-phosphate beta-glucosyltransferase
MHPDAGAGGAVNPAAESPASAHQAPPGLSVVIPAFNEEARLGETLDELTTFLQRQPWDWEIRVVDDGSSDGTCGIVEAYQQKNSRVVLQREPHRGKGGDIAIGSREGVGARRVGEPLTRHVAGRVFNYAVQRLMVPGINDTQCGFKLFTATAVETIFPRVTVDGWAFDIEVLTIARAWGLKVVEVPIEWHYRRASQLSLIRDGARMFLELLRIRARAWGGAYGR